MKRPTIIILIVVLVMTFGVGVYQSNKKPSKPKTIVVTTASKTKKTSPNKNFAPLSTTDVAYVATIKTPDSDGTTVTGTLASDGKGNSQYTALQDGQNVQITYTKDSYYLCVSDQCYKYPVSQSGNSGFNPAKYTYTAAQLTDYQSTAVSKGKKSCAAGTCDVWTVTKGGTTSTLYLDGNKRIVQVDSTVKGKTSTVTFEYKPVTIAVPANAQSITSTTN